MIWGAALKRFPCFVNPWKFIVCVSIDLTQVTKIKRNFPLLCVCVCVHACFYLSVCVYVRNFCAMFDVLFFHNCLPGFVLLSVYSRVFHPCLLSSSLIVLYISYRNFSSLPIVSVYRLSNNRPDRFTLRYVGWRKHFRTAAPLHSR